MQGIHKKIFVAIFITLTLSSLPASAKHTHAKQQVATPAPLDDAEFEEFSSDNSVTIYDPLEKYNRKIFVFNDALDRYFLEYVAKAYRQSLPRNVRNVVRNFLTNLSSPISAMNALMQGNVDNGLATLSNFLINSTIGVGGLFDVASEKGIRYKSEDFGKTLGHYGIGSGVYLMVPLLGPSSSRDISGWIFDRSVSPMGFNSFNIGGDTDLISNSARFAAAGVSTVDMRESLIDIIDDIRRDSFDPYATIRSAYLQKRLTEIKQSNPL